MNPAQYIALATRTERVAPLRLDTIHPRLIHAVVGIVTETAELLNGMTTINHNPTGLPTNHFADRGNAVEELGDCMWYVAIAENTMGTKFVDYNIDPMDGRLSATPEKHVLRMVTIAGHLMDMVKRAIVYGKKLDEVVFAERLVDYNNEVQCVITLLDVSFAFVLETNIDKLKARFPDKYTDDAAINRDTDAERKLIESRFPVGASLRMPDHVEDGKQH